MLQLLGGTWRRTHSVVPWTLLVACALAARMPLHPLHPVAERHAVDLCLAALLAAWLPTGYGWLRAQRPLLAAAALFVPLALATPWLTPPMYGDEPFHLLVCKSLVEDHDFDLGDDYDLEHHPNNEIYTVGDPYFHSPVTGVLVFPGYLVAGRSGALALLALAAAAVVSLLLRRGRELGVPRSRLAVLGVLLVATYPLATFATQIWSEILGALAVALALVAASALPPRRGWATAMAFGATLVKTRLALATFPIALAAWMSPHRQRPRRTLGLTVVGVAAVASLVFGWLALGHPFGYYRRLRHLLPTDFKQPLTVLGGLVFDPAGGLLFVAPLLIAAIFGGTLLLWRRGSWGERALLMGSLATVLALLHSREWYGGGSPPARYLVPLLPAFALAGAMVLRAPQRWRRAAEVLIAPSLLGWWVLISRPHLSINPGDGGYWLSNAVARRFAVDVRQFFPSFLVPSTATVVVPVAVLAVIALLVPLCRRKPSLARRLVAAQAALWMVASTALVVAVKARRDVVVEAEAPQVQRLGGRPEPPPGTFSRFTHRRGWRVGKSEGVVVPLNLRPGSTVSLEGWLLGRARKGARLAVRWDDDDEMIVPVQGRDLEDRVVLPEPPGEGRHHLRIVLRCRGPSAAVFDRVVVRSAARRDGPS
jgi:hypothetical protein